MKSTLIFIYLLISGTISNGQERAKNAIISDTTYKAWTTVNGGQICNDGRFVLYYLNKESDNSKTLVATSTDKTWDIKLPSCQNPCFSNDNKYLFTISEKDTLLQVKLKYNEIIKTPDCKGYQLFSDKKNNWLICQLNDSFNSLHIKNLENGDIITIKNVQEYFLNTGNSSVIALTKQTDSTLLKWVDLSTKKVKQFYKGSYPSNLIFSLSGKKVAFTTTGNNIFYYNSDSEQIDNISCNTMNGHQVATNSIWRFSNDETCLFFTQSKIDTKPETEQNEPEIWNYKDAFLLSQYKSYYQGASIQNEGTNLTSLNISTKTVTQLLHGSQKVLSGLDSEQDDILVVSSSFGGQDEILWNPNARISYYLYFIQTGELRPIAENRTIPLENLQLSPNKKFLIFYDPALANYFCYDLYTKKTKAISDHISGGLYRYNTYLRGQPNQQCNQIVGWIANTNRVIIQGTYDLWELDIEHTDLPINLTKGDETIFTCQTDRIIKDNKLLIRGFRLHTQDYQLYELNISKHSLVKLFSSDKISIWDEYESSYHIQKAKNANAFLLTLQSAAKSPNYYFTTDFKNIIPISDSHPEKNYNWITSAVINYKDEYGNTYKGVLYKPANFDSTKRYPVIFDCYLIRNISANHFIDPGPASTGLNIPLMVSNGYLVCQPNIYYLPKKTGEAALNSVLAAADYLSYRNWIDTAKMGLNGHSWGGFEINYIITKSNHFKAAVSVAGVSSQIENYNDIWQRSGLSKQGYLRSNGMIDPMEKAAEDYVNNSPILFTRQIHTPLLLMHNTKDTQVPVDQSLQMFVQLRSEQKPVWLLQYKNEGHTLAKEESKLNFQRKVKDFFDYYLKDGPAPKWMNSPISNNQAK